MFTPIDKKTNVACQMYSKIHTRPGYESFLMITGVLLLLQTIVGMLSYFIPKNYFNLLLIIQFLMYLVFTVVVLVRERKIETGEIEEPITKHLKKSGCSRILRRSLSAVIWVVICVYCILIYSIVSYQDNTSILQYIWAPFISLMYKLLSSILIRFESHKNTSNLYRSKFFKYFVFKYALMIILLVQMRVSQQEENCSYGVLIKACYYFGANALSELFESILYYILPQSLRKKFNFNFFIGAELVDDICDLYVINSLSKIHPVILILGLSRFLFHFALDKLYFLFM